MALQDVVCGAALLHRAGRDAEAAAEAGEAGGVVPADLLASSRRFPLT